MKELLDKINALPKMWDGIDELMPNMDIVRRLMLKAGWQEKIIFNTPKVSEYSIGYSNGTGYIQLRFLEDGTAYFNQPSEYEIDRIKEVDDRVRMQTING